LSRWLAARERNLATALAPLIALLAAWSPLAARGDETNPPVRALDKVDVIAAPPQDDRRESTTTRIVVSHDDIVRYGDASLADVLRRLPGVTVDGVPGRDRAIRLRGLGNGYTRVLLNGDPVPPGFSLDSLEPSQIERIEILRAPTADLGAQAIAGTINIVLRNATHARHMVKGSAGIQAGEPLYALDTDFANRDGAWSWSVAGAARWEKYVYPTLAVQRATDPAGNVVYLWRTEQRETPLIESISLTPRVTWQPGDRDSVTSESFFRFRRVDSTFREATTTLAGAPPTFASDDLPYHSDTTTARTQFVWNHHADRGDSLESKLGVNYNRREGVAQFHGFDVGGTFILDRNVRSRATDEGAATAVKYITPRFDGHALALGFDGEFVDRDETRFEIDTQSTGVSVIDERYRARVTRAALYAQDEWNLTPRWSAYWGLRYETLHTRTTGSVIEPAGNRVGVLSPVLQTLWKSAAAKGDQVRASVSRTFKAPTTYQLTPRRYVANNNSPATPDFQGNPDLEPELAWGVDAAYEHYFADDTFTSVSVYARRIDDVILTRLANVRGTWISFPANDGSATVYGVEAEVKGNVRDLRPDAPNVALRANVTFNRSRVSDVPGPDNRLERQTPVSANVGFDWSMDSVPVTVGASFSYIAGGRARVSLTQADELPYKRIVDAYLLWKVDAATSLRLSFADLLAQDRFDGTSFFDGTGTVELHNRSATHTAVRLTVEWSM
jgi:outer membrane receptor protein involved in Fe transport